MKKTFLLLISIVGIMSSCCTSHNVENPSLEGPVMKKSGNVTMWWIKDKPGISYHNQEVFKELTPELMEKMGHKEGYPTSMSCFFLKNGKTEILFDAGLGMEFSQLIPSLMKIGKNPKDIKLIYITHLHPDHIGGLLKDGVPVFKNATLYMSRLEYESVQQSNAQQVALIKAYENKIKLFEMGDTLPGEVRTIAAPGHTPGHTVYQCGLFLIVGDIMHAPGLQITHPDYCAFYDQDKALSIESRKDIIAYASRYGLIMAGMHFPEGFESYAPDDGYLR